MYDSLVIPGASQVAPPDDPTLASYEGAIRQYNDVVVDAHELQLT
jgi:hypothetical protein